MPTVAAVREPERDEIPVAAPVRYYSVRRLNPYQGTVQIAEVPGFRAMSVDGITWQIQVLQHHPRISGYGTWRADGSGDLIETDRTRELLRALREHPALPFAALDRFELWLLDARDRLPLALLASAPPSPRPPRVHHLQWRAALAGDGGFVAASLGAAPGAAGSHIPHRDIVDRCVQHAAGPQPAAQWFLRDAGGRGAGLDGCTLEPDVFPEMVVREEWSRGTERDLVREYHDWLAPALLTHRGLRPATRDRLERAACRQAEKLYRLRHLLGDVINTDLVKVAMVEAVLRRSARS